MDNCDRPRNRHDCQRPPRSQRPPPCRRPPAHCQSLTHASWLALATMFLAPHCERHATLAWCATVGRRRPSAVLQTSTVGTLGKRKSVLDLLRAGAKRAPGVEHLEDP